MAGPILLVCPEWPERALLRAQLIEAGHDVIGVDSWANADRLLLGRFLHPTATVAEISGHPEPKAALIMLGRLVSPASVLVLTSASSLGADAIRALGFTHLLVRPFSVDDVVRAVKSLVSG